MEKTDKTPDTIRITYDGKDREIRMTYGLQQLLCSRVSSLEAVENMHLDAGLQALLMNEVLAERDEKGKVVDPDKQYAMFLGVEEGEKLMDWIAGHLVDFFISRSRAQQKATDKVMDLIAEMSKTLEIVQEKGKELKPVSNGSEGSASKS